MERKIDEWEKSQNISSKQTDKTDPPPPMQAHTEQVNVVFTRSGKSNDSMKIQTPPLIIVNNKTEKDKPIKTSKGLSHNIPEEDVEPKQIIFDPDDQAMWESAKTVAPTPSSDIIQLDVDHNFVNNTTYLNMICENKFDGYLRADPHDHIREFLSICDMFRYGKTQNIPEEDVEPKQMILDPDDQPIWESAKTVAPTPNSAIIQLDVDDNFVINITHLNMIRENKFDGYLWADLHDHIREFLAICDMFRYGKTQKLNNDVRNDLKDFKRCVRNMRTVHSKLYERDDGSGKSDDSLKIQTPPPIIVNIKTKKDKPIKKLKKGYHMVKTNEYPFRVFAGNPPETITRPLGTPRGLKAY
uniref:Reverse transcriptase domain-containing protein n=1 Tax=Tanacetum cinerariifolium TaxID=118510 RepID=A0A699GX03_TANCI|nr:reverse transcriptase domain-containing protein [Tanacetum cinerariifolium]